MKRTVGRIAYTVTKTCIRNVIYELEKHFFWSAWCLYYTLTRKYDIVPQVSNRTIDTRFSIHYSRTHIVYGVLTNSDGSLAYERQSFYLYLKKKLHKIGLPSSWPVPVPVYVRTVLKYGGESIKMLRSVLQEWNIVHELTHLLPELQSIRTIVHLCIFLKLKFWQNLQLTFDTSLWVYLKKPSELC